VFGVLGVDISESYLISILNYEKTESGNDGSYVLGIMNTKNAEAYPSVSSGSLFKEYFGKINQIGIGKKQYETIYKVESRNHPNTILYGSLQQLHLYNSGSAFENKKWVLMNIMKQKDLFAFSEQLKTDFALATLISLILGIFGMILISKLVTKPIISLVKDLKQSDPKKVISLRKIDIDEIDELSKSIEKLSSAVAESSSKFYTIIAMTDVPLGVFEYQNGNPTAFCSKNVFSLLDWPYDSEKGDFIDSDLFFKRMDELKKYSYDEEQGLILFPGVDGDRWLKITYLSQGEQYFGSVFDVTQEFREKKKIEYERDYDSLTNLFNRRAFHSRMEELFHMPETLKIAALVMWDLDNLKYINDTYGHDCGDKYIGAFAQELRVFRSKNGIVARRSGDEFYAFLYGYDSKEELRSLISEGCNRVKENSFDLPNGSRYRIHASAGIA